MNNLSSSVRRSSLHIRGGVLLVLTTTMALMAPAGAHAALVNDIRTRQTLPGVLAQRFVPATTPQCVDRAVALPVYELAAASPDLGLVRDKHGVEHEIHPGDRLDGYGRVQRIDMEGVSWTVHTDNGMIR